MGLLASSIEQAWILIDVESCCLSSSTNNPLGMNMKLTWFTIFWLISRSLQPPGHILPELIESAIYSTAEGIFQKSKPCKVEYFSSFSAIRTTSGAIYVLIYTHKLISNISLWLFNSSAVCENNFIESLNRCVNALVSDKRLKRHQLRFVKTCN